MTSKSAAKLIPSDPSAVMVIRSVTPELTTLSVPFARFGLLKIGGRATVVKLRSGSLAVFSPVALTEEVRKTLADTGNGQVKYLIAPDIEHHIFLSQWAQAFPDAAVIGPHGLPEKREQDPATRGTKFAYVFSPTNKRGMTIDAEFDAEFEYEYFHAHTNRELVFAHKPSRTLIQADVLFNLPATEQYSRAGVNPTSGILTTIFASIMTTRGSAIWQQRMMWYVGSSDRKAFKESVECVDKWDFDRIISCHGEVIETGGKQVWEKCTRFFREAKF